MGSTEPSRTGTDAEEFAFFVALYPRLRRFAAVVADADMDPDDVVQDALTSALVLRPLSELDHPAAYLRRAIVRCVANRRRRARTWRRLLPQLAAGHVSEDHYPSDLAVLDHLSPLDRAVVFLLDVEGLTGPELATQLGVSPAAVRKRASRARAQLRSLLDETTSAAEPLPEEA
ncbi:MAG: sigma-70 family RNA polymerase sigma factor [Actinomycetota bacterium]